MEKEIIRQILCQFNDFKKDQIILIIVVLVLFIIINILQAVYTSRLIDKYRNDLKKKEIRFSVFNELQINKLSRLFELTTELKTDLAVIYNRLVSNEKTIDIKIWTSNYQEFDSFYGSSKYIVPKKIKTMISNTTKKLIDFNCNIGLLNEKLELTSNNKKNISAEKLEECLGLIENQIKDYNFHNETLEIMIFCEELKEMIEDCFEKME
ncbi:MAG: hypothetical protein ACWA6U_00220 [Breznakibacter sp.]